MTSHSRINLDYSPLLRNIIYSLEYLNLKNNKINYDVKILHKSTNKICPFRVHISSFLAFDSQSSPKKCHCYLYTSQDW